MPTVHKYEAGALPAPHGPKGFEWMSNKLAAAGYTNPSAGESRDDGLFFLKVDELHVSKNQLAADVTPPTALTVNRPVINVPPGTGSWVKITGPPSTVVKVYFQGVGFVRETQFVISEGGFYNYQLGPCPFGHAVVEPQLYDFFVEGTSVAPVAVLATFR